MSDETRSPRPIDDRLFDRLADSELDAADRRELLSALDTFPDGWRRCALAFLEAQAWRSDLRATVDKSSPNPVRRGVSAPGAWSVAVRARRAAVLAAAVVIAFATGWLVHPGGEDRRDENRGVSSSQAGGRHTGKQSPSDNRAADPDGPGPGIAPGVRLAGVLTLTVDDHGQPRTVQVPVMEGPGIDTRWLLEQPPAIRASVVQALERRGHKVEAHRQLLTVNLKDGRKLILPVDEVDVRSANRVYQ
jgi:hypothetical protein